MIRKTLFVLCFCLFAAQASAQWQPTTFHGSTFALAWNGDVIVASDTASHTKGFDVGELYSTDLGMTWQRSENGPPAMMSITALGHDFYGASFDVPSGQPQLSALWVSHDDARTWTKLSSRPGWAQYIATVSGFLCISDTAILSSRDGIAWKPVVMDPLLKDSTLGDSTWKVVPDYWIWVASDSLIECTPNTDRSEHYLTTDLGVTWSKVSAPQNSGIAAVFDASTLVAANDSEIYRSTDRGNSWTTVYTGRRYGHWFYDDATTLGTTRSEHLLSTDKGLTWMMIDSTGMTHADITAHTVAGGYLFFALYSDNIYRLPLGANAGVSEQHKRTQGFVVQALGPLHVDGANAGDRAVIYDALGRSVLDTHLTPTFDLDIRALPPGLYILSIAGSRHLRFVK